jgi:hypothetical protein
MKSDTQGLKYLKYNYVKNSENVKGTILVDNCLLSVFVYMTFQITSAVQLIGSAPKLNPRFLLGSPKTCGQ